MYENTPKMLQWLGLAGVAGVLVVASVATFVVASSGDPAQPQSLSEIPGFRRSAEGTVADDTILFWEAFSREEHVQDCMSQENLDYTIEAAFPTGPVLSIASSLDIVANDNGEGDDSGALASESVGQSSAQQNMLDDLMTPDISPVPVVESDQYFMPLYGETAADVAYVESTGFLPEGRNDFARGGCVGASWDAIPGLYELRSEIFDDVREAKVTEMAKAVPCVTTSGVRLANQEDLDAALAAAFENSESVEDVMEDMESCETALHNENEAANDRARATVFSRHKQRLLTQHERYGSIVDDVIEPDQPFTEYLKGALAEIEDEPHTHSP